MKFMPKALIVAVVLLLGGFWAPESRAQTTSCSELEGTWSGTISGRFTGPITLTFNRDCSYRWVMTAVTTNGRITRNGRELTYANAAGSRGRVTRRARSLTFRNIFTGNNYTVRVRKQGGRG